MKNQWLGATVAAIVLLAIVAAPLIPMIVFGIAIQSDQQPETGPQPSDEQLIVVAKRHRAALDDLLRMRREHRIGSIDVRTGTYRRYCSAACPQNRSIPFDSNRQPWKRYVSDLHDLRALSVASGYELMVIVWKGGGWRNLPRKGYMWTDRRQHECVVSDLSRATWDTCLVAYHPIGRNWYTFQD